MDPRPTPSTLPPGATPLGAQGCWFWSAQANDVDTLARAQPWWHLHYEQLSPGTFDGHVRHAQLPGLRLVEESSGRALRQRGDLGHDSYGFAMPLKPAAAAIFNGQRTPHHAIMVGRSDELDLCTPDDFALIGAVVDRSLLAPLWERMYQKPLARWLEQQLVVPARPAAADALRALHLEAMARVHAADVPLTESTALLQLRDAILIEWIETLPESVDTSELPTAAARKRIVDRACALMLSAPDEPLSMLEVCRRIGTSRRKLNYCFQDVLGTSPVKYLRAVRLNGVRRELRGGKAAVQDIAARWGFWHLGQFSLDYKRQFGELPSTTLRAARAATG
ncbi:MAG: helix-turn-helix domain-containing protein [Burkholderiaceae bacterium]|nr:helix-turn-helix domain-containing protein [Burkholderiaceae bacterium]